ncbi:MAG: DUF4258 domain-containing protein [Desulfarculus sp.]|nr:DUF4258 domain-containing protein [Desulfarculus sp.]
MNLAEATAQINQLARLGWVFVTKHCELRMSERGVDWMDLEAALCNGKATDLVLIEEQGQWRVTVQGRDASRHLLTIQAALPEDLRSLVCITVY